MWSDTLSFYKVTGKDTEEKHLEMRHDSIYEWVSFKAETSGKRNPSRPALIVLLGGRF